MSAIENGIYFTYESWDGEVWLSEIVWNMIGVESKRWLEFKRLCLNRYSDTIDLKVFELFLTISELAISFFEGGRKKNETI